MAYPIPVPEPVEKLLKTSSEEELEQVRTFVWKDPGVDQQTAAAISYVINYELQLRQQEPLWRKAARFYNRHEKEIQGASKLLAVFAAAFGGAAAYDYFDGS